MTATFVKLRTLPKQFASLPGGLRPGLFRHMYSANLTVILGPNSAPGMRIAIIRVQ